MPDTTIIPDAKELYDREIERLQGECATLEEERRKLKAINLGLTDSNAELEKRIEKNRQEIVRLGEQITAGDSAFQESRANSLKALEARDRETVDRASTADEKEKAAQDRENQANAARNRLFALADDLQNLLNGFESRFLEVAGEVEEKLSAYLALRDPEAPIPSEVPAPIPGESD